MSQFPESAFWDFSLEVYAADGVAPACLELQERRGVDVNLLLYCCWLGRREATPAATDRVQALAGAVETWHDAVVRQLRAVRKRLKTPLAAEDRTLALSLRQRVQKIEIDAEHIEQLMLEAADTGPSQVASERNVTPTATLENMRTYLSICGAKPSPSDDKALGIIAQAAARVHPIEPPSG